jgi:hypothetical protein
VDSFFRAAVKNTVPLPEHKNTPKTLTNIFTTQKTKELNAKTIEEDPNEVYDKLV